MHQPNTKKEFVLYTDASAYALGAVLAQIGDDDQEHVVSNASCTLKGAELHYGISEKECLAVLFAIKIFRIYLYGTHFKIVTDHSALKWLMEITDQTGRLARWAIYLQIFDFEIIHRRGILHTNADTLSRPPIEDTSLCVNLVERVHVQHDIFDNSYTSKPFC